MYALWKGKSLRDFRPFKRKIKMCNADVGRKDMADCPNVLQTALEEIATVKNRRPVPTAARKEHIRHLQFLLDAGDGLTMEWPAQSELLRTHARRTFQFEADLSQKCAMAEALLRVTLDVELELAHCLQEALDYWSDQRERPTRAWLALVGPWTWGLLWTSCPQDKGPLASIEGRLASIRAVMRRLLERAGKLQLHLAAIREHSYREDAKGWLIRATELLAPDTHWLLAQGNSSRDNLCATTATFSLTDKNDALFEVSREWLHDHGRALLQRIKDEQGELVMVLAGAAIPPWWRRKWLHVASAAMLALPVATWLYRNREAVGLAASTMQAAFAEFVHEHLSSPARAIVSELLNRRTPSLADQAAIADAHKTLERMINDFLKDAHPKMPPAERKRLAANHDMSLVSDAYAGSIVHSVQNIISGDLVRMLLIQVQHIQKELLVAMAAMEELMNENELNLRVMATVPTFMLGYFFFSLSKKLYYSTQRHMKSREQTYYELRSLLCEMERLLNLRSYNASRALEREEASVLTSAWGVGDAAEIASSPRKLTHGNNEVSLYEEDSHLKGLEPRDVGRLLLLVYSVRKLVWSAPRRFPRTEQKAFQGDLCELLGEEGPVGITQQLAILNRMARAYIFLRPEQETRRRLLL